MLFKPTCATRGPQTPNATPPRICGSPAVLPVPELQLLVRYRRGPTTWSTEAKWRLWGGNGRHKRRRVSARRSARNRLSQIVFITVFAALNCAQNRIHVSLEADPGGPIHPSHRVDGQARPVTEKRLVWGSKLGSVAGPLPPEGVEWGGDWTTRCPKSRLRVSRCASASCWACDGMPS